eukprot:TRINITY_DN37253_c0_g1_i1.p1 TRINITY_DN37253_c0_g1~~TRINITY_DN37253_c0_g1_i1.p1  ORF type:complete len:127 (-),score=7.29 TRINITY_DN37253_c0_g1_i1:279-659(-)
MLFTFIIPLNGISCRFECKANDETQTRDGGGTRYWKTPETVSINLRSHQYGFYLNLLRKGGLKEHCVKHSLHKLKEKEINHEEGDKGTKSVGFPISFKQERGTSVRHESRKMEDTQHHTDTCLTCF